MMSLSEIDYPPCWLDRHVLRVAAATCQLVDDQPGQMEMCLGRRQVVETIQALDVVDLREFLGVAVRSELEEAVDHLVNSGADRVSMLDWARHLELLAAKLRGAAG